MTLPNIRNNEPKQSQLGENTTHREMQGAGVKHGNGVNPDTWNELAELTKTSHESSLVETRTAYHNSWAEGTVSATPQSFTNRG